MLAWCLFVPFSACILHESHAKREIQGDPGTLWQLVLALSQAKLEAHTFIAGPEHALALRLVFISLMYT